VFSVHSNLLFLGLAGVLFAIRLGRIRTFPFGSSGERLLLFWMATVLFLAHPHKLPMFHYSMPYLFQLITTLVPPVILLGVVVIDPAHWPALGSRAIVGPWFVAAFLVINGLSSVVVVRHCCRVLARNSTYSIRRYEMDAYLLIGSEATEDDVVLAPREGYPRRDALGRKHPAQHPVYSS
jgi:hypothetical protein